MPRHVSAIPLSAMHPRFFEAKMLHRNCFGVISIYYKQIAQCSASPRSPLSPAGLYSIEDSACSSTAVYNETFSSAAYRAGTAEGLCFSTRKALSQTPILQRQASSLGGLAMILYGWKSSMFHSSLFHQPPTDFAYWAVLVVFKNFEEEASLQPMKLPRFAFDSSSI